MVSKVDIPKQINNHPKQIRKLVFSAVLLALVIAIWMLSLGSKNINSIDKTNLVIGEVRTGDLVRDVRATGSLVPINLRWISARVEGRIEQADIEAGAYVTAETMILEMSNPTLSRNVDNAKFELDVLEAQADVLALRLTSNLLTQQAVVADYISQYESARLRMEANQSLGPLAPQIATDEAVLLEQQLSTRLRIEKERLAHLEKLNAAELRANSAEMNRARRQLQLQEELLDGLKVRAGIEGVLQDIPIEVGQEIRAGALLARVAGENNLKAELRVQESQIASVRIGQSADISAGGNHVTGRVSRIDPSVQNGVVVVDVSFDGNGLVGARPDLRIEGVIELDFIKDSLILSRPVFTQESSSTSIFVLNEIGNQATRVEIMLGVGSVNEIQVLEGLQIGDKVILSDTSQFRDYTIIELVN